MPLVHAHFQHGRLHPALLPGVLQKIVIRVGTVYQLLMLDIPSFGYFGDEGQEYRKLFQEILFALI